MLLSNIHIYQLFKMFFKDYKYFYIKHFTQKKQPLIKNDKNPPLSVHDQ